MTTRRWQDLVALSLGFWLFLSPFILDYYLDETPAALIAFVYGLTLMVTSSVALAKPEAWEEWVNLLIGVWLIAAPFVLGFDINVVATWNHVVVGALVAADSLGAMIRMPWHKVATR
jgi:uncharacterized membrane protein